MMKWLGALCLIGAAGYYAHETGSRLAQARVTTLESDIDTLTNRVTELESSNQIQASEIAAEHEQAEAWRTRYERDVPKGELKALVDVILERRDAGVPLQRLQFVVSQTEARQSCDPDLVSKRFLVETPLQRGVNNAATFDGGVITISAQGISARDAAGNPEAWFDPAQPVQVRLTKIGGGVAEVAGTLPLHPAVVAGGHEYRFTLLPGARGFMQVSMERCKFP